MIRSRLQTALVFIATFVIHATSPVGQQGDSRWTVFTAVSLLREGNTSLNEFKPKIEAWKFYAIECIEADGSRRYPIRSWDACPSGRLHNFYPIAVTLLALPAIAAQWGALLALAPLLTPVAERIAHPVLKGYLRADYDAGSPIFEVVAASVFAALAAALFHELARRFVGRRVALAAAFLFACCSPLLSTASRSLWQHGPLICLLTAVLLALSRRETMQWAVPLLVVAFYVRPTAAVPIVVFGAYLLRHERRALMSGVAWAFPVVFVFTAINWATYGQPLAPYFFPSRAGSTSLALHDRYWEALAGNLVSPARGVLVYMPFLALLPFAWRYAPPDSWRMLAPWAVAAIVGHWLLISFHQDWWGGHSYGPRYFSDMTPFLIFLMLPVIASQRAFPRRALMVLAACAFLIHFRGSHSVATQIWNETPVGVNEQTSRLWDWRDPPFLR